ncbi:MAG: PEP-CTERM sorting domain-containing protein [Chitinophagaceae bacterium]|nr:PEP-CTERM sorting domain-containing protein [Rubrivivax sp.]
MKSVVLVASLTLIAASSQAQIITQWNFNSPTPDASTGTGSVLPSIGVGTAALTGGTTATFASGDANGGSTDPAVGDDSGWNLTNFPAANAANKTAGASFFVSTQGFSNIVISYDLRHSNTSSRFEQVQYSINGGVSWVDAFPFDGNAGDTWFNGRTVNLSGVAAVNNNSAFAFRVVAAFIPGNVVYQGSALGSMYSSAGTWRVDMATVTAVPEPGIYAMLLAGLAAVAFIARRRR